MRFCTVFFVVSLEEKRLGHIPNRLQNRAEGIKPGRKKGKKNTAHEGGGKYALKPYDDKQKENWANSKNIVVYKDDQQLLSFITDSIDGRGLEGKMYFEIVPDNIAQRVNNGFEINIKNYNCTLRASKIRKILKSHGNERTENQRGQR